MTDWRTIPWAVNTTDAAVRKARAMIEDVKEALEVLKDRDWKRGRPDAYVHTNWNVDGTGKEHASTSLEIMVQDLSESIALVGLLVETGGSSRTVHVTCSAEIFEHLHGQPGEMVRLTSELLSTAIEAEDRVMDAWEAGTGRRKADPQEAMRLFEIAERHVVDMSKPIMVERSGSSPLSPSSIRIVGSMKAHADPSAYVAAARIRLSVHPGGVLQLKNETSTMRSDGFDAMEILHMHRRPETMP